jgi:peptidoglycan/xylan/chitin deacetylase (PgdA/CDA1 family)
MTVRATLRRSVGRLAGRADRPPSPGRVLLYHEVADGPDPSQYVPPDLFRRQLEDIGGAGLSVRTVGALVSAGFPAGALALSFDDGYRSAAAAAERVLSRGWTATLFVVPEWIDVRPGIVGWADLARLSAAGIEVGAHGFDHSAPCGKRVDVLTEELRRARETIEQRIAREVRGLAYPFGLAPAAVRTAAHGAGFTYACTTEPGANRAGADRLRLRRNEVLGTDAGPGDLLAKLGGSDDWMLPVRRLENMLRCRGR